MRKWLLRGVLAALICSVALPAHAASVVLPDSARFMGRDLVSWHRTYMTWALGSADSPVVTGECGEVIDGVFFLAPAAVPGTTELECEIPTGTPILALVGVTFSEIPTWGADDEAVLADALATWEGVDRNSLVVDGDVQDVADNFRVAGVYDVPIEEGSVFDVSCEALTPPCTVDFEPPGPVRVASVGIFAIIRPLPPGEHHVVASTANPFVEITLDATIHVG